MPANPEIVQYIIDAAKRRGIDPDIALKVSRAEALNVFDPSKPDQGGDEGSSFGPFQLHYAGISKSMPHPGMGDDFTRATGLNARDPSTWRQQVDFALDRAAQGGWSPWMGAKAAGVANYEGIKGAKPAGVSLTSTAQGPTLSGATLDTTLPPTATAAATPADTTPQPPTSLLGSVKEDIGKDNGVLAQLAAGMQKRQQAAQEAYGQFSQIQPSGALQDTASANNFQLAQNLMQQLLAKRKGAIPGLSLTGMG